MKEQELRAAAECACCGQPFGNAGVPLFWRVTIERHGVLLDKVRRQDGLAQYMGNSFLAGVMGPNEEMTQPMMEPVTVTVCEACAVQSSYPIAFIAEQGTIKKKGAAS